ncbi:MAG: DUF2269 domain-containing protein [Rubrivivax sp.]|nr:DUF2269 domain-containing protein [Rubrivivax sp.]
MSYLALKTLHVVSSSILFGTGIGTAFFMWMVNRSGDRRAMAVVTRHVIKADLYFTTPSVVVQPLSGLGLMWMAGAEWRFAPPNWLGLSVLLFALAGACWLPVLWLQWRMHRLAALDPDDPEIPGLYWRYERAWVLLGIPAFTSLVVVFWLMVAKPF